MLALILLAAAALTAPQQASLECVDIGATQTPPIDGPGGASAVLNVSTEDDHSENSHECSAEYQLLISAEGGGSHAASVLTSDGEWGRNLSLKLSGFSQDGKRLFGILVEGGKYPLTMIFDYHAGEENAQIIDIVKVFKSFISAECSSKLGGDRHDPKRWHRSGVEFSQAVRIEPPLGGRFLRKEASTAGTRCARLDSFRSLQMRVRCASA